MLTGSKIQTIEGWFVSFAQYHVCSSMWTNLLPLYKHFYMYKRILKALIIDILQFVMTHEVATDQSLACCWQDFHHGVFFYAMWDFKDTKMHHIKMMFNNQILQISKKLYGCKIPTRGENTQILN